MMDGPHQEPDARSGEVDAPVTRRRLLSGGLAALTGVSALAAAASPLRNLDLDDLPSVEEFLQEHYKEMTPEDKKQVFERIAESVERRHGVKPNLIDPDPIDNVEFVYGLNLSRCVGCRRCVHACVKENSPPMG